MTNKKYTTTIRITENIREKLRNQADEIGMDMSSYIAYLVMYKEQKEEQERNAKALTQDFLKTMGNFSPEMLSQLQNKGDE